MIYIFFNSINDEFGEIILINLFFKMRFEVRVKCFMVVIDDICIFDDVFWIGLKVELVSVISYFGVIIIVVKICGINVLVGLVENKFNVILI